VILLIFINNEKVKVKVHVDLCSALSWSHL